MQKIQIRNFGPINKVDLDVKDFIFFIGPQASGKSTISKCIFFFKSIKDDLMRFLIDVSDSGDFDKPLGSFGKIIRHKFIDFWGPTFHLSSMSLKYYYTDNIWLSIKLEEVNKYVTPTFSHEFREIFRDILHDTELFSKKVHTKNKAFLSSKDLFEIETLRNTFISSMELKINKLFNDEHELMFIPAGRSLIATLSDHLQGLDSKKMDYIMRAFTDKISNARIAFNKSLKDIVTEMILLTKTEINKELVNLTESLVKDILRGTYKNDKDGEKIYFSDEKFTKLNFSSSGQQESIWILLIIFLLIVEKRSVFLVIEEPEAHLYPNAQKRIMELIALLSNVNNNQVILTTHSPYILASLNNLLYAYKLGRTKPVQIQKLINRNLWIDLDKCSAFSLVNGNVQSIIDIELNLLKVEEIDTASQEINNEFDELYKLDEQ